MRMIACSLDSCCSLMAMNVVLVEACCRTFCFTWSAILQSVLATRNQKVVISFLTSSILYLSGVVNVQ